MEITHGGLRDLIAFFVDKMGLTADDVFCLNTTVCFDPYVLYLYGCLATGGRLVIPKPDGHVGAPARWAPRAGPCVRRAGSRGAWAGGRPGPAHHLALACQPRAPPRPRPCCPCPRAFLLAAPLPPAPAVHRPPADPAYMANLCLAHRITILEVRRRGEGPGPARPSPAA